jgi:ribosomal protein S13
MSNLSILKKNKIMFKNSFLFLQSNIKRNNLLNYFFFIKNNINIYLKNKYIYNRKMITISRNASKLSIRVIRRLNGFPNRGQRTSSNAKTAKKRLKINNLK